MAGIYPLQFKNATHNECSSAYTETSGSSTDTSDSLLEEKEEEPLPVPPPEFVGSLESRELLKHSYTHIDDVTITLDDVMCCKPQDKNLGQSLSLIGWDNRSFKSRQNLPKKKALRKAAKVLYRQSQVPTKDGFVFRHYHDVREYIKQYRRVHTCGGVGRTNAGEAQPRVLGVDTEDPYMARLRNVGFWFDRYELIESLAKTGAYSRSTTKTKITPDKSPPPPIRSPRDDMGQSSPREAPTGDSSSSNYVKLSMSRYGPALGAPLKIPNKELDEKPERSSSPKPHFRGYIDFKALTINTNKKKEEEPVSVMEPVSTALEVTTLCQTSNDRNTTSQQNIRSTRPLSRTKSNNSSLNDLSSQEQTNHSINVASSKSLDVFSRLSPPKIPKCIGKASDPDLPSYFMRNRRQTSRLDAGDNKMLTRSLNAGLPSHKSSLDVGVCDVYSTSSGGSAPKGTTSQNSFHSSSTMSNTFHKSTKGHIYKHHCTRKLNMSQSCQSQHVTVSTHQ